MKKRLKETIFPIICLLEKKMNAWPELDRSRMEEPEDAFSHNSQGTEGGANGQPKMGVAR
ncbi:MAG: hypothetical protein U0L49_09080 [Eubacterium sp.]|nr:hypothetical protein [Eubacterium sp.]